MEDDVIVISIDAGGSEAQMLRSAMEATGRSILVIHVALRRLGQGEIPGGAAATAMGTRQWGSRVVQEADDNLISGPIVSMGRRHSAAS